MATAAAVLLGPGAPAALAQATAPPPVQNYVSCLNGQRAGDLLLLIDESGSLAKTDPDAARVTAAKLLLGSLASRTERARIALDVQVAGFATSFDRDPGAWTPLTQANLPGLTDTVNGFAQRNKGQDTDYWLALEGARRSLADHAKAVGAGEAGRCQAIAWFSDGRLDIEPRTSAARQRDDGTSVPYADGVDLTTQAGADAAEQAAATSLCRPGGQADQLRTGHIVMFGIGLAPPGTPDNEFDLMRSITTGAPYQNQPCGAITDPPPGTFQPASDLDDLLFAFGGILGTDVATTTEAICAQADTSCRGHEFVLDESIDGFRILGQADAVPGLTAELVGPDGQAHALSVKDVGRTTDLSFGAVRGTYTWQSDRTVDIQIANQSQQPEGWTGVWALRFVDPNSAGPSGTSKTNIQIWSNIEPRWVDAKPTLPSGAPVPDVRFELGKIDGPVVPPQSLRGTFSLDVDLVDPTGKVTPVAKGLDKATLADPVTLDLTSVPPGQATLRLSLDMTTAPAKRASGETVPGTKLSTRSTDIPLKVELPLGYPTLPARIDFGSVEGATDLTTNLTATGPGCVWVPADAAPKVTTTPDGVSGVTITADGATTPQTCLALGDGETRAVTLHLRADHTGNGTASGTLPVSIAPRDRPDQARTVDVAFTGDLRTPLNQVNFIAALIVALLLGPGIPLGLLYLVKWATAKIPARGLYTQVIPVTVEGGRTLRDGAPFGFRPHDFVDLADIPSGGTRRLVVDDVVLRTRTGGSPFGPGYVSVEPVNPQTACLAPGESQPHGYTLTSRLPLAVARSWVVLHDPAGPPDAARVLVLIGADVPAAQRDAFAAEIAERLPEVLERLRSALERSGHRGGPPAAGSPDAAAYHGAAAGAVPAYGPAGGTYPAAGTYGAGAYPPGGGTATYGPPGGTSAYGPSDYDPGGYGPPGGSPTYGTPTYGTPTYGTPTSGPPQYGTPPYAGPDPATSPHGGAPPTNQGTTPYGDRYGPTQTPPGPPTYGAPTWDGGRFGGDEDTGNGTTRPVGPGERGGSADDPPDHGPGRGPSYGPRG